MLLAPCDHYYDDFGVPYRLQDGADFVRDVRTFVTEVLRGVFAPDKWRAGPTSIYIGFQISLSRDEVRCFLGDIRRQKYLYLIRRFLTSGVMFAPEADQMGGRLQWSSSALFGRIGRAFLPPIFRRKEKVEGPWFLNKQLRLALIWWEELLASSSHCALQRVVPVEGRDLSDQAGAISYGDASPYGIGGVLLLPRLQRAYFFRLFIPVPEPIERLETEAQLICQHVFGPLLARSFAGALNFELAFLDNNLAAGWLISGNSGRDDIDPMIHEYWMNSQGHLRWLERVGSKSNLADKPSRGQVPDLQGWHTTEIFGVRRWAEGQPAKFSFREVVC